MLSSDVMARIAIDPEHWVDKLAQREGVLLSVCSQCGAVYGARTAAPTAGLSHGVCPPPAPCGAAMLAGEEAA